MHNASCLQMLKVLIKSNKGNITVSYVTSGTVVQSRVRIPLGRLVYLFLVFALLKKGNVNLQMDW
jgi:hypothetical protein